MRMSGLRSPGALVPVAEAAPRPEPGGRLQLKPRATAGSPGFERPCVSIALSPRHFVVLSCHSPPAFRGDLMSRSLYRTFPVVLLLAVAAAPAAGPDPSQWRTTVDKAVAFLTSSQAADGSWSRDR